MATLQARLLAALVAVLLVGGGSYRFGHSVASDRCAAERTQAADAAVDAAREAARARSVADGTFARAGSAARVAEVGRRVALEADIARAPAAVGCGLDDAALRLLNGAIDSANSFTAAPGGLPGALPADTGIDQREPAKPP